MTKTNKLIIEALELIQTWYECDSPLNRRELDRIIQEIKKVEKQ